MLGHIKKNRASGPYAKGGRSMELEIADAKVRAAGTLVEGVG
jgi:hypothetical protein